MTFIMGSVAAVSAAEFSDVSTVRDGNVITAFGAGAAFDFGFELLAAITGDKASADRLSKAMKYKK